MMTRKDFEAIASAVSEAGNDDVVAETPDSWEVVYVVAGKLADVCAESNERFDRDQFLRACGMV